MSGVKWRERVPAPLQRRPDYSQLLVKAGQKEFDESLPDFQTAHQMQRFAPLNRERKVNVGTVANRVRKMMKACLGPAHHGSEWMSLVRGMMEMAPALLVKAEDYWMVFVESQHLLTGVKPASVSRLFLRVGQYARYQHPAPRNVPALPV